jgi:hypothetical protein
VLPPVHACLGWGACPDVRVSSIRQAAISSSVVSGRVGNVLPFDPSDFLGVDWLSLWNDLVNTLQGDWRLASQSQLRLRGHRGLFNVSGSAELAGLTPECGPTGLYFLTALYVPLTNSSSMEHLPTAGVPSLPFALQNSVASFAFENVLLGDTNSFDLESSTLLCSSDTVPVPEVPPAGFVPCTTVQAQSLPVMLWSCPVWASRADCDAWSDTLDCPGARSVS